MEIALSLAFHPRQTSYDHISNHFSAENWILYDQVKLIGFA